jgi:hypothetical protein
MNKVLCISAAVALALSSAAFAGGKSKHGASAQTTTSSDAQISMSDCSMLRVKSARNECMRHARANGGMHSGAAIGATGDRASGSVQGGAMSDPAAGADRQTRGKVSD